ncbi:MAG: helix-turn-helix domain-containing protein [Patescibacteria group bacterium]
MKRDDIARFLIKIGLSELEASCYFNLLKQSPQRASELSKKLSVPKATILNALYRMSDEMGIVKRSKRRNSFLFLVEDAKDIFNYLERKELQIKNSKSEIESLLPEMRSMQNFETRQPKIYYYEGAEGMKQVFEKLLEEADGVIGYGSNEDDHKYLPELYPDYYDRRVQKKIQVKAIIPALPFNIRETIKNELKHQRKTHLVPKEWNYPVQVNIYKNTAAFYSLEESFALVIKSKPIAGCLKKVFELAFEKAAEYDKKIRNENSLASL